MKKKMFRALLLENIDLAAVEYLTQSGIFQVTSVAAGSLSEQQLLEQLNEIQPHFLGVRSKTQVNRTILESPAAKDLLAIGCFCIGTDQVDLECAKERRIAVFNAPFASTRSVAELIIAEIICLARRVMDNSMLIHYEKLWHKSSARSYEVRGKTLGIVGYGHVGSQVGVLAESLGMNVQFYDIERKMSIGCAKSQPSLERVLETSDFVTLHVPATSLTEGMIGANEIQQMKRGSYLLNASRGNVVDLVAVKEALASGHLAGCAVDVYPNEPATNVCENFETPLQHSTNTILTSHIGGSTAEAQRAIGIEVAQRWIDFAKDGTTLGVVNGLPMLRLSRPFDNRLRVAVFHANVPGTLQRINSVFSAFNITQQELATEQSIGYLVFDLELNPSQTDADLQEAASSLSEMSWRMLPA